MIRKTVISTLLFYVDGAPDGKEFVRDLPMEYGGIGTMTYELTPIYPHFRLRKCCHDSWLTTAGEARNISRRQLSEFFFASAYSCVFHTGFYSSSYWLPNAVSRDHQLSFWISEPSPASHNRG